MKPVAPPLGPCTGSSCDEQPVGSSNAIGAATSAPALSVLLLLCGTDGIRAEWVMGWSEDPTQSALRAVIACANRLLAPVS